VPLAEGGDEQQRVKQHVRIYRPPIKESVSIAKYIMGKIFLLGIDREQQVGPEDRQIHDDQAGPRDELLLGHVRHLDVHCVVHVEERVQEGRQDGVRIQDVTLGDCGSQEDHAEHDVK